MNRSPVPTPAELHGQAEAVSTLIAVYTESDYSPHDRQVVARALGEVLDVSFPFDTPLQREMADLLRAALEGLVALPEPTTPEAIEALIVPAARWLEANRPDPEGGARRLMNTRTPALQVMGWALPEED